MKTAHKVYQLNICYIKECRTDQFIRQDLPKITGAVVSEGLRKPSSNSLGNRLVFASISVTKPEQRWMFTLVNSASFTFPVSAASGVSSEPPSPTIMPSLLGINQHQPKEELKGPSYSVGLISSSPVLVFFVPFDKQCP